MTSTLQQEAARKLGFNAKRTMQVAQGLYEGVDIGGETIGLITYMRTDGITMVPEAINEAREVIGKKYGARYVPRRARVYTSKAKNAQEAHEAVRPTSFARTPEEVARYLDADAARLYELIWKRAVASQMESRRAGTHHRGCDFRRQEDHPARHRHRHLVRRLPHPLSGRRGRRVRRRRLATAQGGGRRCHQGREGQLRRSISPSRRRAIPKPAWCKQAGRAGHRPAFHLCLHPFHLARPRLCADGPRALLSRRQGPAGHHLPQQLLPALCRL